MTTLFPVPLVLIGCEKQPKGGMQGKVVTLQLGHVAPSSFF